MHVHFAETFVVPEQCWKLYRAAGVCGIKIICDDQGFGTNRTFSGLASGTMTHAILSESRVDPWRFNFEGQFIFSDPMHEAAEGRRGTVLF